MNAIASFHRFDEGPNKVVFEIEPASPSGMFVLITFLSQVILTLVLGGIIFVVFTVAFELPLIGAVLGLALPFAMFWLLEWRHFFASQRYRNHRQIKVSPMGVESSGEMIPQNQVTHLELRAGSDEPEQAMVVARSENFATDMAGTHSMKSEPVSSAIEGAEDDLAEDDVQAVRGQMAERSYLLTMRPRQSSELKVLAGGLTLECGQALVHDLSQAIRDKMPALDTHER